MKHASDLDLSELKNTDIPTGTRKDHSTRTVFHSCAHVEHAHVEQALDLVFNMIKLTTTCSGGFRNGIDAAGTFEAVDCFGKEACLQRMVKHTRRFFGIGSWRGPQDRSGEVCMRVTVVWGFMFNSCGDCHDLLWWCVGWEG